MIPSSRHSQRVDISTPFFVPARENFITIFKFAISVSRHLVFHALLNSQLCLGRLIPPSFAHFNNPITSIVLFIAHITPHTTHLHIVPHRLDYSSCSRPTTPPPPILTDALLQLLQDELGDGGGRSVQPVVECRHGVREHGTSDASGEGRKGLLYSIQMPWLTGLRHIYRTSIALTWSIIF